MKSIIIFALFLSTLYAQSGLLWQDRRAYTKLTFEEAVNYCQDLNHKGYNDWRLPSLTELTNYSKTIDYIESDTQYFFWSSTINKLYNPTVWFVSFNENYQHFSIKTNKLNVKCVRSL